jgi:serine/threonine protein kinase
MKNLVGQTLGHYRIEASLGYGGMGQVFRGRHVYLERPAAIKVMHDHLATHPAFRTRFLQEAQSTAALRSPHIVGIYEFGEQDGLLYLIMEMMTEGTLSALLHQYVGKQIAATEQARWLIVGLDLVRQAAEGLAAAHALGMIHRDIKPDNLLLTRLSSSDGQYQLKVSDFGLARLPERSGLTGGGPVGTPAYMSPEQCQNGTLDGRSDLYSLGVVLYEVVTGRMPFQINNFKEAVQKHVNALPPPLHQVYPDLPPPVEHIILRCLAKTPQERYQTGQELADALQEAINMISVEPRVPLVPPAPPSSPLSQAPRIHILDLNGQTIRVGEVTSQGLIIGRRSDCDMVLSAETVSRHHLQVKWDGKETMVTDLNSSHGTMLGNEKLMPQVSRVWGGQQTVSIGPFLLRLEMPSTLEVPLAKEGKVELAPIMPQPPQGAPAIASPDWETPKKPPNALVSNEVSRALPIKSVGRPLYLFSSIDKWIQRVKRAKYWTLWAKPVSSKKKSGLRVPLLVTLIILIIVSSIVGVGIYQNHVAQVNADATATAQANGTATAQTQATATARVNADATTTAQANATATAQTQATATAQVGAYPSYLPGGGTLKFVDPLNQESGSQWHNDGAACNFTQGAYSVSEQDTRYFQPCHTSETYSNFAFEVHLTIKQGDCGGMIFRDDSSKGNYYLFSICVDGQYDVLKYVNNSNSSPLLQPGKTAINGLGQQNKIAIVASGSTMTFYVNEKQIGDQVQDNSYTSGLIALIASPLDHATEVAYTNAKLWTL